MMMDNISRKTGNVADFPLKLNLQLFAEEGYPELEESADFKDDAKEFNAKMDKFVQDRTKPEVEEPVKESVEPVKVEEAEKLEVVEPEKPKQDSETNKAFQEMRKKLEEQETKAKKADELISKQWGHLGIHTVEQYEKQIQLEQEAENNKRYEEAGLTPDEIEKLRDYDRLKQETTEQKETRAAQETIVKWQSLYAAYPDLVDSSKAFDEGKVPEWFTAEMREEIERGASPLAAYRNAHFETILQSKLNGVKETATQDALDKINSKDHLAPNASTGGEVDHVEIDEETMRAYRALNKGKTDAQIRAWHKKHAN